MSYSTEPRKRKCVERYVFLSFARTFGDKYGKRIMETATKTGIDVSKKFVQKTAETTGA